MNILVLNRANEPKWMTTTAYYCAHIQHIGNKWMLAIGNRDKLIHVYPLKDQPNIEDRSISFNLKMEEDRRCFEALSKL